MGYMFFMRHQITCSIRKLSINNKHNLRHFTIIRDKSPESNGLFQLYIRFYTTYIIQPYAIKKHTHY